MPNFRRLRRLAAGPLMVLTLALAGCATQSPDKADEPEADPRIEQAREAADTGRLQEAIELFEAAAEAADDTQADRLWLRAGLLHARKDARLEARQALVRVDPEPQDPQVRALRQLLAASLRLPDEPNAARRALKGGPPDSLPDAVREHWLASQARALAASDQPMAAARARQQRQQLLTAGATASANRNALWRHLMAIPMSELRQAVPAEPDTFGGWLELAHGVRTNRLEPDAIRNAVDAWYQRYPDHPARETAFAEVVVERALKQVNPPEQIAVLLPLSGRLAAVGRAVQNGFMAAYYARDADNRPDLVIYDIGDEGRDPEAAYEEATERGVDLVLGPLTKSAVAALSEREDRAVPVLALNRIPNPGNGTQDDGGTIYQFGLAPEDDAREAARLMLAEGWRHAVALTPSDDWGTRVVDTFVTAFEDGGGRVLEADRYSRDTDDFSGPIKSMLNLDASEARFQRLRRTLQRSLTFEPRRRRDVDAVFTGASPEAARLIKPQIRFHRGVGLPTVATSHAYAGFPQPEADNDLGNLIIVDTPWTLGSTVAPGLAAMRETATQTWPEQARRQPRLMALGADAFRLTGPVDVLAAEPSLTVPGLTGDLSVDANGLIHRALRAGRFRNGVVAPFVPLEQTPPTDTDDQANREASPEDAAKAEGQ